MRDAPTTETTSRKEQRRLLHHDVSRSQLLDAAEEVFGLKGFHEATLKEVAELAEFSVGSVYSFFESKDDVFRQIFVRRGEEFMPKIHASNSTPWSTSRSDSSGSTRASAGSTSAIRAPRCCRTTARSTAS
jgi:AcrR family transcriptional regulator